MLKYYYKSSYLGVKRAGDAFTPCQFTQSFTLSAQLKSERISSSREVSVSSSIAVKNADLPHFLGL